MGIHDSWQFVAQLQHLGNTSGGLVVGTWDCVVGISAFHALLGMLLFEREP